MKGKKEKKKLLDRRTDLAYPLELWQVSTDEFIVVYGKEVQRGNWEHTRLNYWSSFTHALALAGVLETGD